MRCNICLQPIKKPVKPYLIRASKNMTPTQIKTISYKGKKLHLCNTCFRMIAYLSIARDLDYEILWED